MPLMQCPIWHKLYQQEAEKAYFKTLQAELKDLQDAGQTIYPPAELRFNALQKTAFKDTKVVIIGQDPYHGPNQAHGLSFSVNFGVKVPPSLKNIYKELLHSLTIQPAEHGNLTHWAEQGVLLLNSVLTVTQGKPQSHQKLGWENFTNSIIETLNQKKQSIVYLLWGKSAQQKQRYIDTKKHKVLTAVHPSPLSAHRGFIGCEHFKLANQHLEAQNITPIDWQLPLAPANKQQQIKLFD
ncbi:uracil-DNA glycosylase [Aliikangiella sp. IMCC44632]